VARTEPAQTTVVWDGREEAVDYLKPVNLPLPSGGEGR